MPLSATDFVTQGPIRSADMKQFVDLFTGVMTDQPITFKNALSVGGTQGASTAALSLYGAPSQTSNLINLYPNPSSLTPTFGFAAYGAFGWGAGGTSAQDTFLSRIGTQNGHSTDTAGLLVSPHLETAGTIIATGLSLNAPGTFSSVGNGTFSGNLTVGGSFTVTQDIHARWLYTTDGSNGVVQASNGSLYLRSAGGGNGIIMDTGSGGLNISSGPLTVASTLTVNGPDIYCPNGWIAAGPVISGGVGDLNANRNNGTGYVFLANASHYIGFDGNSYQLPTSALNVPGGLSTGNLTATGNVSISGAVNTSSYIVAAGRIQTNGDFMINNSPANLFFGADGTAMLQRPASPIAGANHPLVSINSDGFWLQDSPLVLYTPNDPQGGGQTIREIAASNRSASTYGGGEVHISIRLYCDGDITAGTWVHGMGFIQTSDPNAKAGAALMSDAACTTRVKDTSLPVYSYQLTPPVSGGFPAPTPTDIGFMATDVYLHNPEFVALDSTGSPVAVSYPNMCALLWGALRDLNARCAAFGI